MIPFKERFEKHFNKVSNSCWLWTSGKTKFGYGTLRNNLGKQERAHRIAYALYVGEIPDGLLVLHKCDVPACVNPEHLFLGTYKDNSVDMINKGRGGQINNNFSGHLNPNAKLTIEDKNFIENSLLTGLYDQNELAIKFCVHRQAIWRVCKERGLTKGWVRL